MLASVNSHTMGLGSCPRVQPMKGFNMNKMLGEWYVIQKFATSSSCMKYNFTQGTDGKMRLVQTRQHFVLDTIGVDHIYTYTGVLSIPDNDDRGRMRVKFPLNVAGDADLTIFATDYDNYAGMLTCQKILFGHTKCGTILSRKPTLEKSIVNQLRQKLEEDGVDPEDFSIVDQSNCIKQEQANFNLKIDDKTFSAGNVAGVVKKVGGVVGAGVEKAGDIMGSGITKAADITSDIVERYGTEAPPKKAANELDAEWVSEK